MNEYKMFTYYGHIDVSSIFKKLSNLDWDEYDFRQKTFDFHSQTKTVPLLWNEVVTDHLNIIQHPHFKTFEQDLFEIQNVLPPGRMHVAILINLPAGCIIPMHIDGAVHFKLYKRIHIPIMTNPDCLFTVGSETIHMKTGEIWEINNHNEFHEVVNRGKSDRVHLLIDYFTFE